MKEETFSMIRVYNDGVRVREVSGLTWEETKDEERFPLGILSDERGKFRYLDIYDKYWK